MYVGATRVGTVTLGTTTSFDLATADPPLSGTQSITVVAVGVAGQSLDSPASGSVSFTQGPQPWPAPGNVRISGVFVHWDPVTVPRDPIPIGARYFYVYADGIRISGTLALIGSSFSLASASPPLQGDSSEITVVTTGPPFPDSRPSDPVTFTVFYLSAPEHLWISSFGELRWDTIWGASGYRVYANGKLIGTTADMWDTYFDLETADPPLLSSPYELTVVAVGQPGITRDSPPSMPYTFTP